MKRFFDLSLVFLLSFMALSNFGEETVINTTEISPEATEIYSLIMSSEAGLDITLEDVQKSLDNILSTGMEMGNLPCNPVNCCYVQAHWDMAVATFGCCIPNCPKPCLDTNGNGCIDILDLVFISSNFCGN